MTLPDEIIETGHPNRGLQLVALRVHSHCELPMNTRHVASVILPTLPTGVPHCSGSLYSILLLPCQLLLSLSILNDESVAPIPVVSSEYKSISSYITVSA